MIMDADTVQCRRPAKLECDKQQRRVVLAGLTVLQVDDDLDASGGMLETAGCKVLSHDLASQ